METIFREYPDGTIIALFPNEPVSEDRRWCLAFMDTGHFLQVIPEVVETNTKPAEKKKFARTLRKLQRSKTMEKLERKPVLDHPVKMATGRREDVDEERVQLNSRLVGRNALLADV